MYAPTEVRGRYWDPLDLEIQAAVNCPVWMLGTKLKAFQKSRKCS